MAARRGETVAVNTSPICKENKDCDHLGTTKTRLSSSRLSGDQASESMDNYSKCREADVQSSSVKSEISTENGSFEMEMRKRKTQRNHPIATEDGLNTLHDSQHTTESSCSNSLPVVAPVKEAYFLRKCGSPIDSSNSKTIDHSPEEPVTASSESGASAQITSKAIRNANARNSINILSMDGSRSHSSTVINKGDGEISHNWDHEATTHEDTEVLKKTDGVKCLSRNPHDSDNPHCMIRTVKDIRTRGGHTNLPTLAMKGKHKEEFWAIESTDSSVTKRGKKPVKDQEKVIAGFDLNEDVNANEPDDYVIRDIASVSSRGVIHVVAKAGVPSGCPLKLLKFEGELGWKGTAETSAFRPITPSKNLDGKTCCTEHRPKITGIDLNVDVAGDSTFQHSHSKVDQKQAKIPWIDLNEAATPFVPPKAESSTVLDLNLDTTASLAGRSNHAHWLGQDCQSLGNKTFDFPNQEMRDFSLKGNVYMADLSTMQHLANNDHTIMASPHILQSMEQMQRVASHTLPPHSYSANSWFRFGSRNPLPYSINGSHLKQFLHEPSSGNASAFVPRIEVKTENLLSINGSKIDRPRHFPFLSPDSPMSEPMIQEAWYATSLKRKEPEGRHEEYYKQGQQFVRIRSLSGELQIG